MMNYRFYDGLNMHKLILGTALLRRSLNRNFFNTSGASRRRCLALQKRLREGDAGALLCSSVASDVVPMHNFGEARREGAAVPGQDLEGLINLQGLVNMCFAYITQEIAVLRKK